MSAEPMSPEPVICRAGIHTVNGDVICLHCGDNLGTLKTDPDEQYEQVTPTGSCWPCAMGARFPEPDDEWTPEAVDLLDEDLRRARGGPCPDCGAPGACGWDSEGRPLIHATGADDDG